uniref:FOXO protein transactivation domain-containing protein n=1 Tax=Pelusios castaneus TaxID=367368 RepID=A0A8C8RW71_9SAUR
MSHRLQFLADWAASSPWVVNHCFRNPNRYEEESSRNIYGARAKFLLVTISVYIIYASGANMLSLLSFQNSIRHNLSLRLNSQTFLLLGRQVTQNKASPVNPRGKPLEQQSETRGASALPSTLPVVASSQNTASMATLKAPVPTPTAQAAHLGTQPFPSSASPASFGVNQDRLPTDLDVDMYMENLECDVDYIINSDLMDGEGLDFNFEPILSAPSYPNTSQASNQSRVPS